MDSEKIARSKVVKFLSAIPPVSKRGVPVEEILTSAKLGETFDLNTVLTFLKFFNVVKIVTRNEKLYLTVPTQHAYYFIKSLKIYLEKEIHLIDSWVPMIKSGELSVDEILNYGNQFLYAMERNRESNIQRSEPLEEVQIILFIIKAKVGNHNEPKYLFKYNSKRLNLELIGGYISQNDKNRESAAMKRLKEEFSLNKLPKSDISIEKIFTPIVTLATSFENGVYTKFNIYPYFVNFSSKGIKLDHTFQWLSIKEIEKRESDCGVPLRFPSYEVGLNIHRSFLKVLKQLPLSFDYTQNEIAHTDYVSDTIHYTKSSPKIVKILEGEESENLEFKSSARWDYIAQKYNKDLERVIIKTICSLLNTEGGKLIIGVDDSKKVLGISNDLRSLKRKNIDGYTQFIVNLIKEFLGVEYCSIIKIEYAHLNKKIVCIVEVLKSSKPVFYKNGKERDFYVRAGNTSRQLNPEEVYRYIQMHW